MKKILIAAAIVCAAVASQAATIKWQNTANMYASDLKTKFAGTATLHCVEMSSWSMDATFSNGALTAKTTESDFTGGEWYNFYFTVVDGDKTFTSSTKSVLAPTTATAGTLTWGNMAGESQNVANWKSVPEPTSGLLMILGLAGLALRRRRA